MWESAVLTFCKTRGKIFTKLLQKQGDYGKLKYSKNGGIGGF